MHSRKDPGQRLMRWMFKFTGYEYNFKYKPGKFNCNADALSRNPVEEPTEEDINRALPGIKILVLQERKLAPTAKVQDPSGNPNRAPTPTNTSGPRTRPRLNSAPDAPTNSNPRKPGRPIGSKTCKMVPPLNHSTITQRTRGRLKTHARDPDTNPKGDLSLKQDPKKNFGRSTRIIFILVPAVQPFKPIRL